MHGRCFVWAPKVDPLPGKMHRSFAVLRMTEALLTPDDRSRSQYDIQKKYTVIPAPTSTTKARIHACGSFMA